MLVLWMGCVPSGKELADEAYEVMVLRGPSSIAFAQWMKEEPILEGRPLHIRVVDSPEQVQAAMLTEATDIAVLPMPLAANLYNKSVPYSLMGCPIWGTLYLVGYDRITSPVYLFGAGTAPEILARRYLERMGEFTYNYTFATAREVMLALQAKKIETAVLSEPFLSMALRQDSTLRIWADLNRLDSASQAFPQTAIVCRNRLLPLRHALDSLLERSCNYANQEMQATIHILEEQDIFAPKMLTEEAIRRCRIRYVPATQTREAIEEYLHIIYEYEPRAIGGELPDAHFIPDSL